MCNAILKKIINGYIIFKQHIQRYRTVTVSVPNKTVQCTMTKHQTIFLTYHFKYRVNENNYQTNKLSWQIDYSVVSTLSKDI